MFITRIATSKRHAQRSRVHWGRELYSIPLTRRPSQSAVDFSNQTSKKDFKDFWHRIWQEILSRVKILPLDLEEVLIAGGILACLQKTGQPMGIEDVLIASTGLSHHCTLVSANIQHFTRISGLTLENWLDPF